jgi:hypothetical protein
MKMSDSHYADALDMVQPEALRPADALEELDGLLSLAGECGEVATELRRLHAEVERLLAQQAELLAALKPVAVRGEISAKIIKDARAAIAKAGVSDE